MKAKQSSSNIKKPALIMGIAFIALGCTLGASSFAWFLLPSSTKKVNGVDGEATGSYFSVVNEKTKIADGTETNPYGIQNARQLYYFNWLQDLGYFNKDEDKDGKIDQQYFVLMNDIGASEYVLPPAGTTEYPFVGNFDGQGHKISGLTISNSWSSLKDKPSKAQSTDDKKVTLNNAEIVGFFGVVGEYEGDAEVSGYTVSVNEVKDLYFDDLKIETASSSTLVGLIAGYANGQLTNCGVHKGYFDFQYKDSSSNLPAPSVINTGALAGNDKLSQYSLIGAYNSNHFKYEGKPTDGKSGTTWGGSIDFESLSKRISYIRRGSGTTYPTGLVDSTSTFNVKTTTSTWGNSAGYDYTQAKLQTAYLLDGTYLPLNINTTDMFASDGSAYKKTAGETILSSNTGYIVGEGTGTNNSYLRMMHNYIGGSTTRTAAYLVTNSVYTLNQYYAGADTEEKSRSDVLDPSNFSFVWLKNDGNTYRIVDDDNSSKTFSNIEGIGGGNYTGTLYYGSSKDASGNEQGLNLSKYSEVKTNFINAVADATTESFYSTNKALSMHYLMLKSNSSFWSNSQPPQGTFSNVTLNGTTHDSYTLFKGGINFTLRSAGNLTMLCAIPQQANGVKGKFFDIYEVVDSSGTKSAKKIYKICKDKDGNTTYKYDDSDLSSGETLIFDLNDMSTQERMEIGAIYYFEFPMKPGNYFMSKIANNSENIPYIYYLDIGAGANGQGTDDASAKIPPVDFVYYSDVSKKTIKRIDSTKTVTDSSGTQTTVSDYEPSKVTFAISGSPTTVHFYRVRSVSSDGTETITVYYVNSAGTSAATVAKTGTGTIGEGSSIDYSKDEDTTSGGAS